MPTVLTVLLSLAAVLCVCCCGRNIGNPGAQAPTPAKSKDPAPALARLSAEVANLAIESGALADEIAAVADDKLQRGPGFVASRFEQNATGDSGAVDGG